MQIRLLIRLLAAFALILSVVAGFSAFSTAKESAQTESATEDLLSEVRQHFTLYGKPIPPGIFFYFHFQHVATVNLEAAVSRNLRDPIKDEKGWIGGAYKFIGTTDNGLIVVVAFYDGNFAGPIYKLHILDVTAARAFDEQGKPYRRINLTSLRSLVIGSGWLVGQGPLVSEVSISHNSVRIVDPHIPALSAPPAMQIINAMRP